MPKFRTTFRVKRGNKVESMTRNVVTKGSAKGGDALAEIATILCEEFHVPRSMVQVTQCLGTEFGNKALLTTDDQPFALAPGGFDDLEGAAANELTPAYINTLGKKQLLELSERNGWGLSNRMNAVDLRAAVVARIQHESNQADLKSKGGKKDAA